MAMAQSVQAREAGRAAPTPVADSENPDA
jgi:hypothetical protein